MRQTIVLNSKYINNFSVTEEDFFSLSSVLTDILLREVFQLAYFCIREDEYQPISSNFYLNPV